MRLLILANNDLGLYRFRKELLQRLRDEGNEVYISLPYGDLVQDLVKEGCVYIETPIDRRGQNPIADTKLLLGYFKMIRSVKPELVITYTVKPNIYGGFACRMRNTPYAVNVTGLGTAFQKDDLLRRLVTFLYRVAIKKAKTVFFENTQNMQLFIDKKIVRRSQGCVLNGAGVNLSEFSCQPYPEDTGHMRFLFLGRVMQEKGIDTLITAVRQLRAQGTDCTVDVVGDYEENYQAVIKQCEAEGWMKYYGYQSDVRPFIVAAHCVVLPSLHEGMANTNLEAAAMGRPIITSDIPGCRETIIENESGYLCQAGDPESLCRAMEKMAQLSKGRREAMGLAGRQHMQLLFDKYAIVEETIKRLF